MTITDLQQLVARGEGERLEFKKTLSRPLNIARTLAAFANTRGGTVLIGVLDDGRVVGVRDAGEERYVLAEAAALVTPAVDLDIAEIDQPEAPDRPVMVVRVAESPRKPHRVQFGPTDERIYVRAGAESVQTSALQARILRHEAAPDERDDAPPPALTRHEAAVLLLFGKLPRVTVAHVRQLLNLSDRRARQLLLGLTLAGYLLAHDREREPFWTRLEGR